MLDFKNLNNIDSQGMHKIYDKWPEIAKESYESDLESFDFKDIDHIVFAGMGGSGAIVDFFYEKSLGKRFCTNLHFRYKQN